MRVEPFDYGRAVIFVKAARVIQGHQLTTFSRGVFVFPIVFVLSYAFVFAGVEITWICSQQQELAWAGHCGQPTDTSLVISHTPRDARRQSEYTSENSQSIVSTTHPTTQSIQLVKWTHF